MEFLSPTYRILLEIRLGLESGKGLSEILPVVLRGPQDPFRIGMRKWWFAKQRGARLEPRHLGFSPIQRHFLDTLDGGLEGQPILPRLRDLEEEFRLLTVDQIERHLQRLPLIMLLPLLGLIFPGMMLLLMGPILFDLLGALK